jgi:hypothetical protein
MKKILNIVEVTMLVESFFYLHVEVGEIEAVFVGFFSGGSASIDFIWSFGLRLRGRFLSTVFLRVLTLLFGGVGRAECEIIISFEIFGLLEMSFQLRFIRIFIILVFFSVVLKWDFVKISSFLIELTATLLISHFIFKIFEEHNFINLIQL